MKRYGLLVFIPVALALDWFGANPIVVFLTSALAIVPLAGLMGDATEALASALGPTFGGLLNATLGNAPEIIIALFALHRGLINIVKSSLTGSIVGNLLFGLGAPMFAGGIKVGRQTFEPEVARMNGTLLTVASFGLIIPAIFQLSPSVSHQVSPRISLAIAMVFFLVYLASVVYTLLTRKPVVGAAGIKAAQQDCGIPGQQVADEETGWSRNQALGILAAVTLGLAIMSEVLTDALEPASKRLGLTPLFAGVFLLALVGNAAELFNAVRFARKDMMDLSIGITVGASTQVALLVAPILVFFGYLMGQDMNLLFSPFEMWAIVLAVYITRNVMIDGSSNWLEGLVLMAVYFMLGIGFYHLPAH